MTDVYSGRSGVGAEFYLEGSGGVFGWKAGLWGLSQNGVFLSWEFIWMCL